MSGGQYSRGRSFTEFPGRLTTPSIMGLNNTSIIDSHSRSGLNMARAVHSADQTGARSIALRFLGARVCGGCEDMDNKSRKKRDEKKRELGALFSDVA